MREQWEREHAMKKGKEEIDAAIIATVRVLTNKQ